MEIIKREGRRLNVPLQVDLCDCVPKGHLGIIKYCLVGSWKTRPDPYPFLDELEAWAKVA